MNVTCTSTLDSAEYEAFLDSFAATPGTALAYHYPFYLKFLGEAVYPGSALRFVAARDDRGRLVGVLPGLHVRRANVDVWLSLAYFGPNAGALVPDHDPAIVRALVDGARVDATDLGCGSMTVYTPLNARVEVYRAALQGIDFEVVRTGQFMRLPDDPDASPWPRKVRYDIRHASALGVTVRSVQDRADLDTLWEIYRENCDATGIPLKPRAHVQYLLERAEAHGCFLIAEHERQIVAGLVCLFGGGVVSFYLPCTRPEARRLQPGLLLLDQAVARGREQGCRLLNFEASPRVNGSVEQFKARCGGIPVSYHVLVKLLRPGVLDRYRALPVEELTREVPYAFVVPFDALA